MSKKQDHVIDYKIEANKTVRAIKHATRWQSNAEEKICIVFAGLRGEYSVPVTFFSYLVKLQTFL